MGPKITVDSATLMNKALEVIEARWLFDLPAEQIDVIVHPESIVHSFVEFVDGSVLAQLSPAGHAAADPVRPDLTPSALPGPAKKLDWQSLAGLHFEQPDRETFPALDLGFEVARTRRHAAGPCSTPPTRPRSGGFLAGELAVPRHRPVLPGGPRRTRFRLPTRRWRGSSRSIAGHGRR